MAKNSKGNSKGEARLIPRLIVWPAALLQQSTVREGDRHYEENQRLYRCASAMKKLREALSSTCASATALAVRSMRQVVGALQ